MNTSLHPAQVFISFPFSFTSLDYPPGVEFHLGLESLISIFFNFSLDGLMYNASAQIARLRSPSVSFPLEATVTLEVDLRSQNPQDRTLSLFIENIKQPVIFNELPPAVKFAVTIKKVHSFLQFIHLAQLIAPSTPETEAITIPTPFFGRPI